MITPVVAATAPGVRFEAVDLGAPPIVGLRTDVAGFVGVAPRGPVGVPVPVESWRQFESVFGGLWTHGHLGYAVRAFFENGGARCHVVRTAAAASTTRLDPGAPLDASGATSVLVPADGFVAGAVIWIAQDVPAVAVSATVAGVDPIAGRLSWTSALPAGIDLGRPLLVIAPGRVTTRTVAATSAQQPTDRGSSLVRSVAGFEMGAVVQLLQPATVRRVAARIASTDGSIVSWETPLDAALAADGGIELSTGASCSSASCAADGGADALVVAAATEGTWGDGLTVSVSSVDGVASGSDERVAQPPEPELARLLDVHGFGSGDLVCLTQPGRPMPSYAIVESVDPVRRELRWRSNALASLALDRKVPFTATRIDLSVSATLGGQVALALGGLSLVPGHPRHVATAVALAAPTLLTVEVIADSSDPAALVVAPVTVRLSGGGEGLAAIAPTDLVGDTGATPVGLAALGTVDEVAILVVPDAHLRPGPEPVLLPGPPPPDPCVPPTRPPCDRAVPGVPLVRRAPEPPPAPTERPPTFSAEDTYAIQQAAVDQCEQRRDRVCVLEAPATTGGPMEALALVRGWRSRFDTAFAALYHPWLLVLDPILTGGLRAVPPGGHLAGVYAKGDLEAGVHKPPANVELGFVHQVEVRVDEATHGLLNEEGIDAIVPLPGRGIRPMGSRTMSSDPQWRHVNVRRLLCMLEEAILTGSQWSVFEPADRTTRELLRIGIAALLEAVWEAGGLAGASPEESFFVVCDDTNNPPSQVADGLLIVDVGVAPVVPAEFVVVRIGRTRDEVRLYGPASVGAGPTADVSGGGT